MSVRPVALVGGGGHASSVAVSLGRAGRAVIGYVAPEPTGEFVPYLGTDEVLRDRDVDLVMGVGAVTVRNRRREIVDAMGSSKLWAEVVDPTAVVAPDVEIHEGAVVLAGAVVGPGAVIGRFAIVNTAAVVEHDVALGPFAIVSPGAVIGGGTRIGAGSFLGLGCAVRDHVRIGELAEVAMGAVVVSDVADQSSVRGVPARDEP